MHISPSDYELFIQLQTAHASQLVNTIIHRFASGTSAFIVSSDKPWLLNRSLYLYDRYQRKFHSFSFLNNIPLVIREKGVVMSKMTYLFLNFLLAYCLWAK